MSSVLEKPKGSLTKEAYVPKSLTEDYASSVFTLVKMREVLRDEVYENVELAMNGKAKLNPEFADEVADAIKHWALSNGATHFCHWFQPLTGMPAEKHDAFLDWVDNNTRLIDRFSGMQLIKGEPDASSFPSGGLRSTYEARGYTAWDPSSPVFLWKGGGSVTLYIPSVYYSWTGDVLDMKIPLLRSEKKLNKAVLQLLKHTGCPTKHVHATLGWEQEYFLIDRALYKKRPDMVITEGTVFGQMPAKGQELQDYYFASLKSKTLSFMSDFERQAIAYGIPIKTRHNEVAPAQHEIASIYSKASLSTDQNLLMMELMRQVAKKHGLACLFHDKPFAGFNGSGKHCNWSLATDTGENLLKPGKTRESHFQFVMLLTAILHGVYTHAKLLRASVGSFSNDLRLGGHEAPPAIVSVYLGEELEDLLSSIESHGEYTPKHLKDIDLALESLPDIPRDSTDRNRTSPFAYTGHKFEFRAVGASMSCALPTTVINAAVATSLSSMMKEIDAQMQGNDFESFYLAALPVVQKYLNESKAIRFNGDNYSEQWVEEAEKRGLSNIATGYEAVESFTEASSLKLFEEILNPAELKSRQQVAQEMYVARLTIYARLMTELYFEHVYPAAVEYQGELAQSLNALKEAGGGSTKQLEYLKHVSTLIDDSLDLVKQMKERLDQGTKDEDFLKLGRESFAKVRTLVDKLEKNCADHLWTLPKYRELLFLTS